MHAHVQRTHASKEILMWTEYFHFSNFKLSWASWNRILLNDEEYAYERNIPGKYILIVTWLIFFALPVDLSHAYLDFIAFINTNHN